MLSEMIVRMYIFLYQISLFITVFMFWILLGYVDRVHMRERFRRYGNNLSNTIAKLFPVNQQTGDRFRLIIIRPVCMIFEIITGFLEGLEGLEPIIMISSNKDTFTKEENHFVSIAASNPTDQMLRQIPDLIPDLVVDTLIKDEIKNTNIPLIVDGFHTITTRDKKLNVQELIDNQQTNNSANTITNEASNIDQLLTNGVLRLRPLPRRGFNLSGLPMVRSSIQSINNINTNTNTDTTSQDSLPKEFLSKLSDMAKVVEAIDLDNDQTTNQTTNLSSDEIDSDKDTEVNFRDIVDIKKVDEIIETFTTTAMKKEHMLNSNNILESEKNSDDEKNSDKNSDNNIDDDNNDNEKEEEQPLEKITIIKESSSLSSENSSHIDNQTDNEPIKRRKIPVKLARFRQQN